MRRKKNIAVVILALLFITVLPNFAQATQYVRGYYRSNGTYVQPYYRSNPDGYFYNNYSTYGNINPYTGTLGTKRYPSYNSGYSSSYYPSYNYNYTFQLHSSSYGRNYYKSSYRYSNLWDW
jgi:hypothetical protein